ncbi:MAG: hypothetical protein K0M70_06325 [Arenimonas sp.]|uniref:multiheme c-type cytochrome n=1 Tax=Arenimonas sp. TaxID=1872635 RepID=UPI0025BA2DEE|nr:multiheme c-type cytochrome [Arenimonas sp.]MBW8367457.1 hypothetical protein [Arenimonas sp.]
MKRFARRVCVALLLCAGQAWAQGATPLPYQAGDQSLGTVNCANSLCHGAITPWHESPVLQNEYVTWSRLDKHARAFRVLHNERSRAIMAKLGSATPAHETKLCLDCHAHNVPEARRGERFTLSDGVTCEACHGPAERWIQSHVEPGASHAGNIDQGLYPTSDAASRAKLCLSCHWGNADKFVNHRLMAAGHPRMSFELETFTAIAPAHFRVDADYLARKPAVDGVKVWAIGQALAVQEMMDLLADPKRSRDGLFPELVLFDCHACHHPMSQAKWQPRTQFGPHAGPGMVRLNDSGMLMLRAVAREVDPALGLRVGRQVSRLHLAVAGQGDASTEADALKRLAAEVALRIETHAFSPASPGRIALALVDEGLAGGYADYAGAEQAAMAIGSVVDHMHKRGLAAPADALNRALERLNATLADDEAYRPALFQQRLREMRVLLVAK